MKFRKKCDLLARRLVGKAPPRLFSDPLPSWDEAVSSSEGYESGRLIDRSLDAAKLVQQGGAAYERDTVTFEELSIDLAVIAAVALSRGASGKTVRVLDIGGGFGTGYFRHRPLLAQIGIASWNVLETPALVRASAELAAEPGLEFGSSLKDALGAHFDLIIFSSSLQYLPDPRGAFGKALESTASAVLVDRFPVWERHSTAPVVQTTPRNTFPGSYACWLLSSGQLLDWATPDWTLVADYDAVGGTWSTASGEYVKWKGMLFLRSSLVGTAR
jgi:putative methyltransferase (TIGR04325 family)